MITIPALIEPRKICVHGKIRTVGIVILEEDLDHVDMLRSGEGITANANAKRLSETSVSRLCDRLISQRPGARDNTCPRKGQTNEKKKVVEHGQILARTNAAGLVDVTRLNAHLASQGIDDARAVGTHETRL